MIRLRRFIAPALLALAFSLVFYYFNTPLGPSIGSDNAMYLTLGTALSRGYAPYRDIFDHKGPMLYLLEWLPQQLSGGYSTLAVFIMEWVFLTACLFLSGAMADLFHLPPLLLQVIYLAMASPLAGGGNLSEEYTNVFSLLTFYLVLKLFLHPDGLKEQKKGLFSKALLAGISSAFCFLMRANNVLPLFALLVSLSVSLAVRRSFPILKTAALGTAAGLLSLFIPVLAWLSFRGVVKEAWYGAIVHNFFYAGNTEGASRRFMLFSSWYGHMALFLFFLTLLGAAALLFLNRNRALAAALSLSGLAGLIAAFLSHKYYQHYLLLSLPAALSGAALILSYLKRYPRLLRLWPVLICLCLLPLGLQGRQCLRIREEDTKDLPEFTQSAVSLYDQVPEAEQDRFMAYRVEPKWYVVTGALPCMRFYFLQEMLGQVNPAVMDEIVQQFTDNPPLWLVIYGKDRLFSPPYDPRVQEIFGSQYTEISSAGGYRLMHHK